MCLLSILGGGRVPDEMPGFEVVWRPLNSFNLKWFRTQIFIFSSENLTKPITAAERKETGSYTDAPDFFSTPWSNKHTQ